MKNEKLLIELRALFAVTVFTIVYGIGVSWFLEASLEPLYTGGIPGLAQLARNIFNQEFNMNLGNGFLGIFILISNIPIHDCWLVWGFKKIYNLQFNFGCDTSQQFLGLSRF